MFRWRCDGDFMGTSDLKLKLERNVGVAREPRTGRSAKARTWEWESEAGKRKPNPVPCVEVWLHLVGRGVQHPCVSIGVAYPERGFWKSLEWCPDLKAVKRDRHGEAVVHASLVCPGIFCLPGNICFCCYHAWSLSAFKVGQCLA